jgi:uncharacterized protein
MFSWDAKKALLNQEKHGIGFEEASLIFLDSNALEVEDIKHSVGERRQIRIGKTLHGKILLAVYTVRRLTSGKETIRIISARQASAKERKAYNRR